METIPATIKEYNIRAVVNKGYHSAPDGKYVRKNSICPVCNSRYLKVLEKEMRGGGFQGREFCECGWYSNALQMVKNSEKRSNSTVANWAKQVKKRYRGVCAICGSEENLNAHHIFSVSLFPDLAYVPNNGICLCEDCHKRLHYTKKEKKE